MRLRRVRGLEGPVGQEGPADAPVRDTPPPEQTPDEAHNALILGLTGHLNQ